MVDVNSFTCSLIALPTPLPPKKILTNRYNYPLHQQSLWVCNVFLPDIGDEGSTFIVTNAGFRSIWLAACLTGRVERVMVHWAHPATLLLCHPPAICPLSNPLLWNTYPATSSAIYPAPLILIGLIHLRFMFLWLYSIAVSPLVDE